MHPSRRIVLPETTCFITSVTHQCRKWFSTPDLAQIVVDKWKAYSVAYEFKLDAYCVMPDHYHVVLSVGKNKTISQILHAVDSLTATLINEHLSNTTKAKVWQGRPWDEIIRDEEMYWQKITYVLLNPWRRGLVNEPLDSYLFSNIDEWREREGEEFLADLFAKHRRSSE